MIGDQSARFLRVQNLAVIVGLVVFVTVILLMFRHLDKRIESLEETMDQILQEVAISGKEAPAAPAEEFPGELPEQ